MSKYDANAKRRQRGKYVANMVNAVFETPFTQGSKSKEAFCGHL